jgi:predicted phage baseplate assembly protein
VTRAEIVRRCLDALRQDLPELAVDNRDDPAVALVGAWATVVDVLDFYRDRVAAEGYLATATERRSVVELARAVAVEPGPAVAASVLLSFTAAPVPAPGAPGAPGAVVAAGTAARSIPGQDETAQVFQTEADLLVVPERNAVPLRARRRQRVGPSATEVRVVTTGLRAGDEILAYSDDRRWCVRTLTTVLTGPDGVTTIGWVDPLDLPADVEPVLFALRVRTGLFGHNAPDWRAVPPSIRDGYATDTDTNPDPDTDSGGDSDSDSDSGGGAEAAQWPGFGALSTRRLDDRPTLELDGAHPSILPGSRLVVRGPGASDVLCVAGAVRTTSAADFAVAGPVTVVAVPVRSLPAAFDRRSTTVLAQSEPLVLADEPDTDVVSGPVLELGAPVGFTAGAPVIVVGADRDGVPCAQHATVAGSVGTALTLTAALPSGIVSATGAVLGNVVAATAGETVTEVLGSGDGAAANQRFPIRVAGVGHLPAATPSGVASTLAVFVADVPWTRVDDLLLAGPADRVYCVRPLGDDGTCVCFGDGVHGARLPTGTDNVRAVYRSSSGAGGNVGAGTVRVLPFSPLGVVGVDNPLPASGGADAVPADDTRARIPRVVRTSGRVVSPADHLDFALAFAGVRQAALAVGTLGTRTVVHMSVSTADRTGRVPADLRAALAAARVEDGDLDVQECHRLEFDAALAVVPDGRAGPAGAVAAAASAAVRAALSADHREIAQPVAASEILAVAQRVPGVAAVRLTALHQVGAGPGVAQVLHARPAALADGVVVAAQLLVLRELTVREAAG